MGRHNSRWALHRWAAAGRLDRVRDAVERDATDAAWPDPQGRTILHCAADGCHAEVAAAILEVTAGPVPALATMPDEWGNTALHLAASRNHAPTIGALLAASTGPGATLLGNRRGETPLYRCVLCQPGAGSLAGLSDLLSAAPAAALTPCADGDTPLLLALRNRCPEAALMLLRAAPASASTAFQGWSPLHLAARHGMADVAALLLQLGGPQLALARDYNLNTPLSWAAQWALSGEVLQPLLEAAPEAALLPDRDGDLPLTCAAINGNAAAVGALLVVAPGAARLTNNNGYLPIQLALRPPAARFGGDERRAAHLLLAVGPPRYLLDALATADADMAQPLYAELVARWPLSPHEWSLVPCPCPGLAAALPAVLARNEGEAAALVRHLAPHQQATLATAARALARLQRTTAVQLPALALRCILSLVLLP